MNKILKRVLLAAKDIAEITVSATIPGASVIINGIEKLVDHDKTNNISAIVDIESGFVLALNSLKGEEVVNPTLLESGIKDLQSAFSKIKSAVK